MSAQSKSSSKPSSQKAVSKTLKKGLRKIPDKVKMLMAVCLVAGLAAGAVSCKMLSAHDRFDLKGEKLYTVEVGTPFTYAEEGAEAVCFGFDFSGKVEAETVLTKDANGNYVIPTDEEGIYTITYTANVPKFNGLLSGETVKRIRTFAVVSTEEDGRNDE